MKKIAVVGGGASGVFFTLQLLKEAKDIEITIFEKNKILYSILPTGGGRCNLSNFILDAKELSKNYPRGNKALISIFSNFGVLETLDFFKSIGINTYKDSTNRIYPVSNSSKDVRARLLNKLKKYNNVKVIHKEIKEKNELTNFDYIILAGGSKGSYKLAESFGHTITPLRSSLCGYITEEKYKSGVVIEISGEPMLFTHQGISGPYIYKLSSKQAYRKYPFELNIQILDQNKIFEEIKDFPKCEFGTILSKYLPKSLVSEIVEEKLKHTKCANVSKKDIDNVSNLKFNVLSPDKKEETVKAGGVSLSEVNNKFESKIYSNLYFTGEILDVDGLCGGFNLQFAWSSASVVAFDIIKKLGY